MHAYNFHVMVHLSSSASKMPIFLGRLPVVLAVVVFWCLVFQDEADAHARLVSSDPQAGAALAVMPAQIRLVFNEAVDVSLSDVDLLDSSGEPVAVSSPEADPADPEVLFMERGGAETAPAGVYTLVWRVLSDVDGHVTTGSVPFSVGTGEAPAAGASSTDENRPPWWQVVPRWLELAG